MGRKSGISFFAGRAGYFTTIRGERIRLHTCTMDDRPFGPNYRAALAEFDCRINAAAAPPTADTTVEGNYEFWIEHVRFHSPKTLPMIEVLMRPLMARLAGRHIDDAFHRDVLDGIIARSSWGPTTRGMAFRYVRQMTAHAAKEKRIAVDPMAHAVAPKSFGERIRGEAYWLPTEIVSHLCEVVWPAIRPIAVVLAETGARPGEILNAEHFHYDPARRTLRFQWNASRGYIHKNATRKKNPTDRVIYLSDRADAIIRERATKRGFIFRRKNGEALDTRTLNVSFWRARKLPALTHLLIKWDRAAHCIIPYALRHTWATNGLLNGVPIKTLADLMGTSVGMIERHYGHAASNQDAMRTAYDSANRPREETPPPQ